MDWYLIIRESLEFIRGECQVGLLTLMVEDETEIQRKIITGEMELLTPEQVLTETHEFVSNIEVSNCIFRSNHASNYVPLGGTLNRDKERILKELSVYINGEGYIRDERYRML